MNIWLLVFLGGGLGSVARFSISKLVTSNFTHINPYGTLVSNVLATAILGILLIIFSSREAISVTTKALLVIGFCGGFSTFSTFSFETFELLRTGQVTFALINVVISVFLGLGTLFFLSKTV